MTTLPIINAIAYVEKMLDEWFRQRIIDDDELIQAKTEYQNALSHINPKSLVSELPDRKPVSQDDLVLAKQWNHLVFARAEVTRFEEAKIFSDASTVACLNDLRDRIALVEKSWAEPTKTAPQKGASNDTETPEIVEDVTIMHASPFYPPTSSAKNETQNAESDPTQAPPVAQNTPRKKKALGQIFETLLDPRTLNSLMAAGGGLLVIGIAVWLWSTGLFDNPVVAAVTMGGINLGVMFAGITLVMKSRYQLAGKALTLISCLAMPVNLWFYHVQGLITLDEGGHLWIPALFCTIIYGIVARLLKDSMFVYTLVSGVAMTGLLFLADQTVERFWEFQGPTCFLMAVGIICIFVERLFSQGKGAFSRDNFGKAFSNSGHVVLISGLGSLFLGQFFGEISIAFALALVVMAAGVYGYCYLVQTGKRARSVFGSLLAVSVLWAIRLTVDLVAIEMTIQLAIALFAVTSILTQLWSEYTTRVANSIHNGQWNDSSEFASVTLAIVGGLCGITLFTLSQLFTDSLGLDYIVSMGLLIIASAMIGVRAATSNEKQQSNSKYSTTFLNMGFQLATLSALMAGAVAVTLLGFNFALGILLLSIIPAVLRSFSFLTKYSGKELAVAMDTASSTAGIILMMVSLVQFNFDSLSTIGHLQMIAFYVLTVVLFSTSRNAIGNGLTVAAFCIAVCQSLMLFGFDENAPIITGSLIGVMSILVSRFLERNHRDSRMETKLASLNKGRLHSFGNYVTMIASIAGILYVGHNVLAGQAAFSLAALLISQLFASAIAGNMVLDRGDRVVHVLLSGIQLFLAAIVMTSISTLTLPDYVELIATGFGIWMLVMGILGWIREDDANEQTESGPEDSKRVLVSTSLFTGSWLSSLPILIGLIALRVFGADFTPAWTMFHEVGALAIGLALLATGVLLRIRWTTIAGATTLVAYVATLLMLIQLPNHLQSAAVYMMVGGGACFMSAVLLSIYRDRVVSLPKRIREGTGVFQVLKWR